MRVVEAGAHLIDDLQLAMKRRRGPVREELRERLALDVLHGDERRALVLPELEDRDDVAVLQAAGGAGFAQQPLAHFLGVAAFANQLQGDVTADLRIQRPVQGSHAALPDLLEELVVADLVGRPASHDEPDLPITARLRVLGKWESWERLNDYCTAIPYSYRTASMGSSWAALVAG